MVSRTWFIVMSVCIVTVCVVGCVAPGKDADLTRTFGPRDGWTEASVPARAVGIDSDGVITYRGDPEKNVTIANRTWYENGQPKSEFTATGDRSGVVNSVSSGIQVNEGQRIDARIHQLELSIETFKWTVQQALAALPTYFPPPTAAPAGPQATSRRDQLIDGLIERLLSGSSGGASLAGPAVPPSPGN